MGLRILPGRWLSHVACIAYLLCTPTAGSQPADPPSDLYVTARTEFANGNYEKAAELYRLVLDSGHAPNPTECKVRLGLAYQRLKRCDEAIEVLSAALRVPVEDLSPDAQMLTRNQQADAQWGIVLCRLAKGQYELALRAIEGSSTEYRKELFCGNAVWQAEYQNAFYRGLTLEYLDDYPGAVRSYLKAALGEHPDPTASIRLASLYEATGQFDELRALVQRPEASGILRGVVELHDLARHGEFEALVARLRVRRVTLGQPWEVHVQRLEWEAAEAARLLALHPAAALPLLKTELTKVGDHGFVYYALGLSATKEAAMVLGEALFETRNAPYIMTLNYALKLAGDPGKAVMEEVSLAHPQLLGYSSYAFPSHWFLEEGIDFRELPVEARLPRSQELERLRVTLQRGE